MKWSLRNAAQEFGVTRETLKSRLLAVGVETAKTYTTREIFRALAGDLRFEQARLARAKAEETERGNRTAAADWVQMPEVEKLISQTVTAPLRAMLMSLPTAMSVRCNPTDPILAQTALQEFVDNEVLPALRKKLK